MDSMSSPESREEEISGTGISRETPGESIRWMAVLFTDIVASSKFFKEFGDVAGRRMLKEHEGIATPPILEHGGVVVKRLGDSLMSYFFHPWEAVKAAIKIQQSFEEFNRKRGAQEGIHVRIAVHYGEGILEEDDIFGDVVNMAAKFLPVVGGDEVCISHSVHDHVQTVAHLRFEERTLPPEEGRLPPGFRLYRVSWAEGLELDPMMKTLVYMRPLFPLGRASFRKAWDLFLKQRGQVLPPGVERESLLGDRSLAVIVQDPSLSLPVARKTVSFLRLNLGMDGSFYLPLQIIVDTGPFLRGGTVHLQGLVVPWEDLDPGRIHVSAPAYHILRSRTALQGTPSGGDEQTRRFYQVGTGEEEGRQGMLFLYQHAMIQGDLNPCFYCGDRRHLTAQCPSKKLTEMSDVIGKMGYLPVEKINRLFFACLNEDGLARDPLPEAGGPNDPSSWPRSAFYELRSVYQLRLFRSVWNAREEDWNRIVEGKGVNDHGGLVWIAQDCIRVSNLNQAEAILKDSLSKEPEDYKALCAMGLLQVEKGDLLQARFYFKKALDRCHTNPQRTLLLFLTSRAYQLQGDPVRAEESIRRILRFNPYCDEAIYEDVLLGLQKGKEAVAIHQLMRLIARNRRYFVHALIDPELARYHELIHPRIKALMAETREEALRVVQRAREELADLKRWLGDEETETVDAERVLARLDELARVESYFSHLDVLHYGGGVVGLGRRALEERRKRIAQIRKEQAARHARCSGFVSGYPHRFLIHPLARALGAMQPRLELKWGAEGAGAESGRYKDVLRDAERLDAELCEIESRLQRMEVLRRLLVFLGRFLRRTILFQSANLVVAIILLPIVTYYLDLLLPALGILSHDIWAYQKAALSLGSVSGLLLALLLSGSSQPTHR